MRFSSSVFSVCMHYIESNCTKSLLYDERVNWPEMISLRQLTLMVVQARKKLFLTSDLLMPYYLSSSSTSLILHHHHYVESFISCFLFGFSTASKRVHCNITKKAHFWKQEKSQKLMSKQKENLQPAKSKLLFPLSTAPRHFQVHFCWHFLFGKLWKVLGFWWKNAFFPNFFCL